MPQAEYFVGSMVLCPFDASPNVFQIIDGQQRMTTFYLVFCSLAARLGALGAQVPDGLRNRLASADTAPTGEDIHRYRLELQYLDSGNLLVDIANGVDLSQRDLGTRSMRRLSAAYETVSRFLRDKFGEEPSDLVRFHGAISHAIKMIQIVTSDLAGSLRVFETINNRGVVLSAEDLLKNLLFMHATDEQYDSLKDRWRTLMDTIVEKCREKPSRFLRYYILSQHEADAKTVGEGDVYDWFSGNADAIGITGTPVEFVDRLIAAARNYQQFTQGRDPSGETVAPLANVGRFARSVRQHMILLMAAQNLSRTLFERLCCSIEELLFCFIVTHQPGNRYERLFAQWAPLLRGVSDEQSLEQFLSATIEPQKAALAHDFALAFHGLTEANVYPYRLRYILAKLSQHIDVAAWANPSHQDLGYYLDAKFDIEHILPDNPPDAVRCSFDRQPDYDHYAHLLGNLVLLEDTINRSIKNKPFEEKRLRYPDSKILLTSTIGKLPSEEGNSRLTRAVRNLRSFPTWDSGTIRERQYILASLAREVWAMPAPPTEVTDAAQAQESGGG